MSQKLLATFARLNAESEMDNARFAMRKGEQTEQRFRLDARRAKDQALAKSAAGGVALDEGSALASQVGHDLFAQNDVNTIRENAAREASASRSKASSYRSEAILRKAAASSISPFLAGATSLLTSAGRVSSEFYALNKEGAFTKSDPRGSVTVEADGGSSPSALWGFMPNAKGSF
jgi:hypothetical protein